MLCVGLVKLLYTTDTSFLVELGCDIEEAGFGKGVQLWVNKKEGKILQGNLYVDTTVLRSKGFLVFTPKEGRIEGCYGHKEEDSIMCGVSTSIPDQVGSV